MDVIDDEGRLFGVVNVIDALVVLFVLAVLVAGIALVDPFAAPAEPAQRYATVDLGSQPNYVASQISAGDQLAEDADGNLTVTDVYYTPASDGQVQVYARALLRGSLTEEPGTFQYAGQPLQRGNDLTVQTTDYQVSGTITRLEQSGSTLQTTETQLQLTTTVSADLARSIEQNDTVAVAGRQVATIDSVQLFPTGDPGTKDVLVGTTLETITTHPTPEFAGTPVKLGTTIPLRTATYDVNGTIVNVGSQTPPGQLTETTVRLTLDDVSPEIADGIREGMTETRGGTTLATITNKQSENATVVLTSEDGNIYRRDHPVNQDLTLTVTLSTRTTDTGLTFHARSLQEDTDVVLDLGSITVEGTVIEIQ